MSVPVLAYGIEKENRAYVVYYMFYLQSAATEFVFGLFTHVAPTGRVI
jgi:hypothetical protein